MWYNSPLPLVLLLSLTPSTLSAPIPVTVEECPNHASCRPYRHRASTQPKAASLLQEPHFPSHQLGASKPTESVEVRLLEHHLTRPTPPTRFETPTKNPKLDDNLDTVDKDEDLSKKLDELDHYSASKTAVDAVLDIPRVHPQSPTSPRWKKPERTSSMDHRVKLLAVQRVEKCGKMSGTASAGVEQADGKVTVTYTYGYKYTRRDYTSILVVSIVVIFVLAVILIELLDKAIETSRALLGLDQGAIRLGDYDCERGNMCTPYTCPHGTFRLMPAPPPLSTRFPPQRQSGINESSQEKS